MAKKPVVNATKQDGWVPKGFVNLYLTESQIADAMKRFEDWSKTEDAWGRELANGYRFTFSLDPKTMAVVCTANCKDQDSENYGWLLSSFAPTWQEALILTIYKSVIVLDGVWGDFDDKSPRGRYG